MARIDASKLNLEEKVVQINRVAKVVQGGRRFSFHQFCMLVLQLLGNRRARFLITHRLFLLIFACADNIYFPSGQFRREPNVLTISAYGE